MIRTLYLLVTSENPDTYLNAIMHCVIHEEVRKVEFIHIQGFGESPRGQTHESRSSEVMHCVISLLDGLAKEGRYKYFIGKNAGRAVDLREIYTDRFYSIQETYRSLQSTSIQWSNRDIPYSGLRQELAAISTVQPPAIIDVSSVKKIYLGDLMAASLIEGLNSLCTFDLTQAPDYDRPWTMLFHDIRKIESSRAKYRYVNLLDTQLFQDYSKSILVKKPLLRISLGIALFLFSLTLVSYAVSGPSSIAVQVTSIISSFASILSLIYGFLPLRRA